MEIYKEKLEELHKEEASCKENLEKIQNEIKELERKHWDDMQHEKTVCENCIHGQTRCWFDGDGIVCNNGHLEGKAKFIFGGHDASDCKFFKNFYKKGQKYFGYSIKKHIFAKIFKTR